MNPSQLKRIADRFDPSTRDRARQISKACRETAKSHRVEPSPVFDVFALCEAQAEPYEALRAIRADLDPGIADQVQAALDWNKGLGLDRTVNVCRVSGQGWRRAT